MLATTFSLVVVFVPVAFMQGIVGRFFFSFGMTVAVAVMVSLFVAFTLTPMLSSRFLREEHAHHEGTKNPVYMLTNVWNDFFDKLNVWYQSTIRYALSHRLLIILIAVVAFFGSFFLVPLIGTEFLPQYDRGEFWVSFKAGPGTTLEETAKLVEGVEKIIASHKEVKSIYTTIGSGSDPTSRGSIAVKLVDLNERDLILPTDRAIAQRALHLRGIALYNCQRRRAWRRWRRGGGDFNVRRKRGEADGAGTLVEDSVRATPGAVEIDNSLGEGKPELQLAA